MERMLEATLILFHTSFLGKRGPLRSPLLPRTISKYMCLFSSHTVVYWGKRRPIKNSPSRNHIPEKVESGTSSCKDFLLV